VHSSIQPFRHSGSAFKLRIYDTEDTMVAELDVPDPTPTHGEYPIWKPQRLPATASDGDLTVTLKGLTATKGERYTELASKSATTSLNPEFRVTQGDPATLHWTRHSVKIYDALGNEAAPWDCRLCPGEAAWKIQLRVYRNENAPFSPSEQWSVPGISVPTADNTEPLNQSDTVQDVRIALLAIGGAGRVTHFGLTPDYNGTWINNSPVGTAAKQFPCQIDTNSQSGAASTTVQCEIPHVIARVTGLTVDHHTPDLLVVDDQGRKANVYGALGHAANTQFWFLEIPEGAKTLQLTFLVQKGRVFEFLVKPPKIEPTELFLHADELARRSQWPEAAAEFTRALEIYPDNHWHWYRSGCLQVQIGDRAGYRQQCDRMLELFGDTDNPYVAERTAKVCLLWPDSASEDPRLSSLADRAVTKEPDNVWFVLVKGISEYRAGRFESASEWLNKAAHSPQNSHYSRSLAQLFQAMAQHELGQSAGARESLGAAAEVLDQLQQQIDKTALEAGWHDWLMCQMVRREAEQLLGERK
jgi:tetratricopeptide (TPR) repeat protein